MDEVITRLLGEAEAHGNSLRRVVNDLDYGWQIVEKPLSDIAMELLDRGRIAGDELEIFGWFGKHVFFEFSFHKSIQTNFLATHFALLLSQGSLRLLPYDLEQSLLFLKYS